MPKLNLLIFWGLPKPENEITPIEQSMDKFLRVAVNSLLQRAAATQRFDRLIVVTNDADFRLLESIKAEVWLEPKTSDNFHFGKALRQAIHNLKIGADEAAIYCGAGAAALLTTEEWSRLTDAFSHNSGIVTANNYFSADLVGWQPANAIERVDDAALANGDNNLAWGLCRQAGLQWYSFMPPATRTIGTQFDLDTPADVALLKLSLNQKNSQEWSVLHNYLQTETAFDTIAVQPVLAALSEFTAEVLVGGRISGQTHRLLESVSWCQTRVISEERGMRAGGREEAGKVVSLLGLLLEQNTSSVFFQQVLPRLCQAAILDTRVLFAHLQLKPSRRDRFNSDALQPNFILDPTLRAFTEAALEAQIRHNLPLLLGGHTVVAGGLLLLLDLVPPKPYD